MAGASWATFLSDPTLSNVAWAVLDTAAILPLLPSTAYIREGGKTLIKSDELAKFAKTAQGGKAVKAALTTYKYSDGITDKAKKEINKHFKGSEGKTVIAAFEKAANKGLVGDTNQEGIKKLTSPINKIYTHEIKLTGKYGAYRIYGYKNIYGQWYFDYFIKAHK